MALHSRLDSLQTRQQILDAAAKLAAENGPAALTIDGVARVAGMSKGGVLYHFPSKESLLHQLVKFAIKTQWCDMRRFWKADANSKGRWHRAWIHASFQSLRVYSPCMETPAVVATVMADAHLQVILHRFGRRVKQCLAFDGLDPLWSVLLQNSVLGLRFNRVFDGNINDPEAMDALEQRAIAFLDIMMSGGLVVPTEKMEVA